MATNSEQRVPKGFQRLSGSERPLPKTSKSQGPLPASEEVSATLVIRPKPGAPPLPDHEHWHNTPLTARQFLSPQQFADTYGASQSDIDTVTAFIAAHGMKVLDAHLGRRTVSISGTASQFNATFGVTLNRYETQRPATNVRSQENSTKRSSKKPSFETHLHHGYEGSVLIPNELSGIVVAVIGLDNRAIGGPGTSSGDPAGATPLSVPTAAGLYNFPNSGASDQVIGVIAPSDPVGTKNQRLSGYLSNDITNNYFPNLSNASYRTAPASLNDISLTVGSNTYSNATGSVTSSNSFAQEVTQDISTAATIAQGAAVNVYFTEITEQGLLVCLNRILLPEGESQPTVVTCSFNFWASDEIGSIGDVSDTGSAAHQMSALFQSLAAVGVGLFMIAQDFGSNDADTDGNAHVAYPGSDPWVTSVGGTVLSVNAGPPATISAEVVWSNKGSASAVGGFAGATGGGPSQNFPVPFYQATAGITSVTDSKGNTTTTKRCIPDVAAMVSYGGSGSSDWFFINGSKFGFTGTSCACPLLAGLYAVIRSAFGVPLGFFNPLLYQLGGTVANDITSGNNDPSDGSNAPFYTAAAGWDPCSGWGSLDGTKLLNGIAASMYNQTFYFQIEKSTYGLDEVTAAKSAANTPANSSLYSPACWLVLEGYTFNAAKAAPIPKVTGAFTALTGITVTVGAPQAEISSALDTPQRVLYPCTIDFDSSTMKTLASGGIFPSPGAAPFSLPLTALMTIGGQLYGAATVFELVSGADPYFSNFNANGTNVFYLSEDLRAFTVTPGIQNNPLFGIPLLPSSDTAYDSGAAYNYIQALLAVLNANNADATGADVFTSFPDQTSAFTADSSISPSSVNSADPTGTRFSNYSFAVARVRLDGTPASPTIKNVRVFFRMFASQSADTDFAPDWTYPSTTNAGLPTAPLVGLGNPPVTIPFFATGNYESNSDHLINVDYSANSANNLPITIAASGKTWAYFGCYLNVYPTGNTINGNSISSMLPGSHHCLVAQIAFDDAPIVNSNGTTETPENSDKLAQRNLEVTYSDNPGPASTHRIPQTFDTRRSVALSAVSGDLTDYPDELMIDWGDTPVGSAAHVYWPQVAASDVLTLAKKLYSTHQLSALDANTVRCKVPHGFTYIPIPPGTGDNYAGLFTVDLPPGIVSGEVFTVTVRRISTRRAEIIESRPPAGPHIGGGTGGSSAGTGAGVSISALATKSVDDALALVKAISVGPTKKVVNWRYVTGSFAVRIPVTVPKIMLPIEEDTLAIMKWRLTQMSPSNRWYPVLVRYISYLSGRVDGLGGSSVSILPNPYGVPPKQGTQPGSGPCSRALPHPCDPFGPHHHGLGFTGKVMSVFYDRFGDFSGFLLETEDGREHAFHAREREIESLARTAWSHRMVITVFVNPQHLHWPVSIALRRAPRPLLEP